MKGSRDSFVHVMLLYLACSVAVGALGGKSIAFYHLYQCISYIHLSIGLAIFIDIYIWNEAPNASCMWCLSTSPAISLLARWEVET